MAGNLISLPYQPEDQQAILDLIKSRPPARILDYPSITDIHEILGMPAHQKMTRVWKTEDHRLAGYALLYTGDEFASLSFEVDPAFASQGIEDEAIAWAETAFIHDYQGQAQDIFSNIRDSNIEQIRLLQAHGFQQDPEGVVHMARSLTEPIPAPELPAGFSIRCLAGESEIAAWVALHQAAFGTENMTVEYRQSMCAAPHYDPSLDLVAVAPDGRLAAYVVCTINPEANALSGEPVGMTDPVATHPDFQRRGLSRALLLAGMRLLKERGMTVAHLGTASDNIAMQKAAESAGFRITGQSLSFVKLLPRG